MGPASLATLRPQLGLLEHGTISEVAVKCPIFKSIDVVYPHYNLALGQPCPHKCCPSLISLHLSLLNVLPFPVQVHGWRGLVPVPPQLHVLDADVEGQVAL